MLCSAIIPTVGRPTLARAVESVLSQPVPSGEFEVIVVNDSGRSLPAAAWQQSGRVRIVTTNQHNRSVARNTGAAVARGQYLHFLDDDDWMLPGAYATLAELAGKQPAAWLYGGFRLVDNAGNLIGDICPEEAGNCFLQVLAWEWIPLQASWIEAGAFFKVGGFAPLPELLGGCEDIHLSRVIAGGFAMARAGTLVTCIRFGEAGSTTNYANLFQQNRQSREKALSLPGAFQRLVASANAARTPAYWQGRLIFYYLASLKWNLKQKHWLAAASRGTFALAGLALASRHCLSSAYWRGLTRPHVTRLRETMEAAPGRLFTQAGWE